MIHELLSVGEENAKTSDYLMRLTGMTRRQVSQCVETERRAGWPICASQDGRNPGYYLAAGKDDMARYCKSLNRRAGEIQKTRRACLKAMQQLPDGPAGTAAEGGGQ